MQLCYSHATGRARIQPGLGGGGAPVLTKVGSHPWSSPGARNIFLSKVLGERASNEWDFIAKSCLGGSVLFCYCLKQ